MKIRFLRKAYCYMLMLCSLIFTILLSGCEDPPPEKTVEELLAAPVEINIDGQSYNLSTFVWRDFMPPGTGSDLMAVITVSEKNLLTIPANINASFLWIINIDEIWGTMFSNEVSAPTPAHQLERIARGGPKWNTGINVDVVILVTDGTDKEYLLKAPAQLIEATY